jgi:hypothetical protein
VAEIAINGKTYPLRGALREYTVQQYAPPQATDAIRRRSQNIPVDHWIIKNLTGGIGLSRIDFDEPKHYTRFFDSTLETRFESETTLALLDNTATAAMTGASGATLKGPIATADFKGELYGIFEAIKSGVSFVHVRLWDGATTTWGVQDRGSIQGHSGTVSTGGGSSGGDTVTVTVDGSATALTEGVDWTANADAATEAAGIQAAINTVAGVHTTRVTATVTVYLDDDRWTLGLAKNGINLTATPPSARAGVDTAHDLVVGTGGKLVSLIVDDGVIKIHHSTTAVGWIVATTLPTAAITAQAAGDNDRAGKLTFVGTTMYAFLWSESSARIECWISTNDSVTWTVEDTVTTGGQMQGLALYNDVNGDAAPVVATEEGLYAYDVSVPVFQMIYPIASDSNHGIGLTVWNGSVYFPTGWGGIVALTWNGFVYTVQQVGPDRDGGLPTARQGHVLSMVAAGSYLFASYGGHAANKNASIFAFTGLGWHHMFRNTTANEEIRHIAVSGNDDDTPRLHFNVATSSTVSVVKHLDEPLVDPVSGVALAYQLNGYLDLPEFDGGDPHEQKAIMRARLSADDMGTTSQEYAYGNYGVDGAARTTATLGDFTASVPNLDFAGGLGESMKTLGVRLNLVRDAGSTADTPKVKEFEVLYEVWQTQLRGFEADIDIPKDATAIAPIQAILDNLRTALNSFPMVQTSFDTVTTKTPLNVRVISLSGIDEIERRLHRREMDYGEGLPTLTVRMEQRIPA